MSIFFYFFRQIVKIQWLKWSNKFNYDQIKIKLCEPTNYTYKIEFQIIQGIKKFKKLAEHKKQNKRYTFLFAGFRHNPYKSKNNNHHEYS